MRSRFLLLLSLTCFPLSAQPADEVPVFRTTTNLIEVNVVALDKKGKPMAGLTKDDFIILDKGKQQTISTFSVNHKSTDKKPTIHFAPGTFTNYKSGAAPGLTVILLDSLNTPWSNQATARDYFAKFLAQVDPKDQVAIMVLGNDLKVLHSFSENRTSLLEALQSWNVSELAGGVESVTDMPGARHNLTGQMPGFMQRNRGLDVLASLEQIANNLSGSPGRKNLVWVTNGFPLYISGESISTEAARTMKVLNNANIAVYSVDARGLTVGRPAQANIGTMEEFATRTGGSVYHTRNDLNESLREVMEQTETTYNLGYYPSGEKGAGQFHDVKVKVKRPGVELRFRKGYTNTKSTDRDKHREQQLALAAVSPLEATGLAIAAQLTKTDNKLKLQLMIDPAGVTFLQSSDKNNKEVWQGRVDIILMPANQSGTHFNGTRATIALDLTREQHQAMLRDGLRYVKDLPIHTQADQLKIVVRDNTSTMIGSVMARW